LTIVNQKVGGYGEELTKFVSPTVSLLPHFSPLFPIFAIFEGKQASEYNPLNLNTFLKKNKLSHFW